MKESSEIEFRLTMRERALIAEYGYPFDDLNEQLRQLVGSTGEAIVTIDPFYLECLTAALCRSARELTDETLLEEIDALCTALEMQASRTSRSNRSRAKTRAPV